VTRRRLTRTVRLAGGPADRPARDTSRPAAPVSCAPSSGASSSGASSSGARRRLGAAAVGLACATLPALAHAYPSVGTNSFPGAGTPGENESASPELTTPAGPVGQGGEAAAAAPASGIVLTPRIGVTQAVTDNVQETPHGQQADAITLFSPGVSIDGATPRVQVHLDYTAFGQIHAVQSSQDGVNNEMLGTGSLILIPDTLTLQASAYATQTAADGGYGGGLGLGGLSAGGNAGGIGFNGLNPAAGAVSPNQFIGKQEQTQAYGFSFGPVLQHRFGSSGTGILGDTFSLGSYSGGATSLGGTTQPQQALISNEEYAIYNTGDNFGRIANQVLLDAVQEDGGSGSQIAGDRFYAIDTAAYAVNRILALSGSLGYEYIGYGGGSSYTISDATWSAGVELTPNADSSISAGYGHRDGTDSAYANGSYAITARTTLYGTYSEQVESNAEQLQGNLSNAGLSASGTVIDRQTGAPLVVQNPLLGVQDAAYRITVMGLSATTLLGPAASAPTSIRGRTVSVQDAVTVSVQRQVNTPVASVGAAAYKDDGIIGGIGYVRVLGPLTYASVYAEYGTRVLSGSTTGNERIADGAIAATRILSETVTLSAQYAVVDRRSTIEGRSFLQNIALVTLQKSF
jgi:hypothetical protein